MITNIPDNSYTTRKNLHTPCGFSMLTSYAHYKNLNEHIYYRGKDCLSMFSKTWKSEVDKIISIKQKPMDPLTEQEIIAYNNAKICYICEKSFNDDDIKVRDHCH